MTILALDLSKRSTGYAVFGEGLSTAYFGHWVLGSEFTSRGKTYCKLWDSLDELYQLHRIEHLYFEEPMHAATMQGGTNIDSLRVLAGLAAHAESWADGMGLRSVQAVNVSTWRKHFIGSQKRGSKRATLKSLTMERCNQLGFKPRRDDEADALGILDYGCELRGIKPPWRSAPVQIPIQGGLYASQ